MLYNSLLMVYFRKYSLLTKWVVLPIIYTFIILFLASVFAATNAFATHNRAGEITYQRLNVGNGDEFRMAFTIYTYTKTGGDSNAADRDSLDIDFGDGSPIGLAPRINGPGNKGQDLGNNIKYNVYYVEHSYPGSATYIVSVEDPNRIDKIININYGASVDIAFFLQDTLFFPETQFYGYNNSPILYQPPIDYGNVGEIFIHNPNAWDPDGDSLYFELTTPLAGLNNPVPLYQLPSQVPKPSGNNQLTLNPTTGELIWNAPATAGIYNIAILIHEYRNGKQIGNMMRDMQIIVNNNKNSPPEIVEVKDTCLILGQTLTIDVTATDLDASQILTLTAYGKPLEMADSPAMFSKKTGASPITGNFVWPTNCSHLYSAPYTVVFKAEDNYKEGANNLPLADLETWQITLVPPPPNKVQAAIVGKNIEISWDAASYLCANSEKFRGFSVWRKSGCDTIEFEPCQQGLSGTGYTKLADKLTTASYLDKNVVKGLTYTYWVVAEFADAFTTSKPPTPLNKFSSAPSLPVCAGLPRDIPVIINVSIVNTATTDGSIYVAWTKPSVAALDTIAHPGPYRYELLRATGFANETTTFELVKTFNYPSFAQNHETQFTDLATNLNTLNNAYSYRIDFYANNVLVDNAVPASSVFLTITPNDDQLNLSWQSVVPWNNYEYQIYRKNQQGNFEAIATTTNTEYTDVGLINGNEYCYQILALGAYGAPDLPEPLLNWSQVNCQKPKDLTPPCAPVLSVKNCNDPEPGQPNLANVLNWNNPNLFCADDVVGYKIYFQSPDDDQLNLIYTVADPNTLSFVHELGNSLAGCYAVAAIDSFDNESIKSNIVCAENCLSYELPNTFTPNNDSFNDVYKPRKLAFVNKVNMEIFDRWGNRVWQTNDPAINWDGTHQKTKAVLNDGVYYYTCQVFERKSDGSEIISLNLSGYIHLLRGK